MPRLSAKQSKPAVLHQTLEIPSSPGPDQQTKEQRPDFWVYMHALTPEQWKDHIVYLTREKPKTHMNGVVGGYLTKITEPFDIDDIKLAYGGTEFSYIMKRGRDIVYSGTFAVEAPPKIDPTRESMAAAGGETGSNGVLGQFVAVLKDELERSRESAGGDRSTTERAVEMLSSASEKAMDMIRQQVPAASSPAAALKDLIVVAKEIGILGNGGGSSIIDTIKVLKELGLIGQAAPDPMKNLDTMLSVFKSLDELRGSGGGGGRRDWKAQLVDRGIEALPAVLDTLRDTRNAQVQIANDRARAAEHLRHVQPGAAPARPSVMTPRPTAAGAPAEPVGLSASGLRTVPIDRGGAAYAGDAMPVPTMEQGEMLLDTIDRNSPAFTNFLKQTIVEMLERGDHGEQIVDFLDGAKPGFSNTLVQYTPEQLTAFFATDPILRAAVEHPNWSEVLDEARKYILEPAAAEGEEELELTPGGKPN